MSAVHELKPEAPKVTITSHEDYRRALARLGELEGNLKGTPLELERQALRNAVDCYCARTSQGAKPPVDGKQP